MLDRKVAVGGVRRVGRCVSLLRGSSLDILRVRGRSNAGVRLRGRRPTRRVFGTSPVNTCRPATASIPTPTPIRPRTPTTRSTTPRRSTGAMGTPVINMFCTTSTPNGTPFTPIKGGMDGNSAIYVVRTVGYVGRVRTRSSCRVIRILIGSKSLIRCNRPLFGIGWSKSDVGRRRVGGVLPRHSGVLLIRRTRDISRGATGNECAVGNSRFFLRKRFPNGPIIPNIVLYRVVKRTDYYLLTSGIGGYAPCFAGVGGIGFEGPIGPNSALRDIYALAGDENTFCFVSTGNCISNGLYMDTRLSFTLIRGG